MNGSQPESGIRPRGNGPIFIVGAARSGTTMLQYRLRNPPRISLPAGESRFFIPPCRSQKNSGGLSQLNDIRLALRPMLDQGRTFLETDLHGMTFDADALAGAFHDEGRRTIPEIIEGLLEKNARGEGKAPTLVEKAAYRRHNGLLSAFWRRVKAKTN